jgi:hypothetical protein
LIHRLCLWAAGVLYHVRWGAPLGCPWLATAVSRAAPHGIVMFRTLVRGKLPSQPPSGQRTMRGPSQRGPKHPTQLLCWQLVSLCVLLSVSLVDSAGTCVGYCGGSNGCWCDDACLNYNDCCTDYQAVCKSAFPAASLPSRALLTRALRCALPVPVITSVSPNHAGAGG